MSGAKRTGNHVPEYDIEVADLDGGVPAATDPDGAEWPRYCDVTVWEDGIGGQISKIFERVNGVWKKPYDRG